MRDGKAPHHFGLFVTDSLSHFAWRYCSSDTSFPMLAKRFPAVFRRRQVGLIYQFYNLIPVLNVEENITLPIKLDGRKINKKRLAELLEVLGLTKRRKHLPSQLSGGQQQRVSIGRALMNAPAILLADEPTGNLDTQNTQEIMQLLKTSNKVYNQTIILITHDREIALQADRILEIQDGQLVRDEVIR